MKVIYDTKTKPNNLQKNQSGEILIKGLNVIERYWKNQKNNPKIIDGWIYTGDLGHFDDDNYLYIDGRIDDLKHLREKEEFLLADGVSLKHSHFSPNRRLCRILTLNQCLADDYKNLNPWAKQVSETVYSAFDMRPIKFIKLKKFFFPNLLAKG